MLRIALAYRSHSLPNRLTAFLLLCLLGFVGIAAADSQSEQRGTVVARTYAFKEANKDMEYALFVPKSYNRKKPTPLIVLLHGLGSNPQRVISYAGIKEQAEKHGFIVVAPYGFNTGGWYGSRGQGKDFARRGGEAAAADLPENLGELSEKDVLNVLDIARKEFNIDKKRTYLMGHSMGGGGTYYLGMKYKDNWAALAPMAPAIYSNENELEGIKKIPIVVVQGDQDKLVSVNNTRRWVAKMKALHMNYKYIEIPGGDHVQSIANNPDMIAQVFEFLSKQHK